LSASKRATFNSDIRFFGDLFCTKQWLEVQETLMVELDPAPKIGSLCALALAPLLVTVEICALVGTQKSKLCFVIRHAQLSSATLELKTLR
jgi:hypothetical protein